MKKTSNHSCIIFSKVSNYINKVFLFYLILAPLLIAWDLGEEIPELPQLSDDELKPSFLTAKEIAEKKRGMIEYENNLYHVVTDDVFNHSASLGNFCEKLYFNGIMFDSSFYIEISKDIKHISSLFVAHISKDGVTLYTEVVWYFFKDNGIFITKEAKEPIFLNLQKYKFIPLQNKYYRGHFCNMERRTTPFIYWIDSETNHYYPVKINGENIENHKSQ